MSSFGLLFRSLGLCTIIWLAKGFHKWNQFGYQPCDTPSLQKKKSLLLRRPSRVSWISENLPFLSFFLDSLCSRRFRLPYGLPLLPRPMVIDHREKSPSGLAPWFFSVGLFVAAIRCSIGFNSCSVICFGTGHPFCLRIFRRIFGGHQYIFIHQEIRKVSPRRETNPFPHFLSTPIFRFFPSGSIINNRRVRKPRLNSYRMPPLIAHLKRFVQT